MLSRLRPLVPDDAAEIARLQAANRAFLAPWDAIRPDVFYTEPGQAVEVERMLAREAEGTAAARAILDDAGRLAGVIRLNGITRGAFESCSVGYWVDQERNGQGLASSAVAAVLDLAFRDLGLHRVQAETLRHNARSQRVLAKNGFERFGMAPAFLRIAGEWQDHDLFQRLAD
ncbi:GNAT family N-acetyltransferase [Amnibacterium kyonggiense]|uniref:[SSU ribosomal protein S5P]-alanine acetyltransferase n=1 Tax=Amnibacterium kyonggiense TaxID=595671 RepID=A0A4R7FS81_9MICO|nr:GNAT family protein [Amnibacterium kyonggiense]TDS80712.1 [SSU ribosomal protein S5P]-alanine acetyltransferase [Amnibacterium kyonggiense]